MAASKAAGPLCHMFMLFQLFMLAKHQTSSQFMMISGSFVMWIVRMAAEVALANVIISTLIFSLGTRDILATHWLGRWQGSGNALRWVLMMYSS